MELPRQSTLIYFVSHTFPLVMFVLMLYSFYHMKTTSEIMNPYTIAIFVLFVMAALAATLQYNETFVPAFTRFTLFSVGLIGTFAIATIIYNTIISYFSTIKNASYFFLILVAVIIGGALVLTVLSLMFSNETVQAILKDILALPNAVIVLTDQFVQEFPNAPPAFMILFILEVILILIAALIPFLISQNPPVYSSIQLNGVYLLQKDPLNLTDQHEIILTNSRQLSVVDDSNQKENPYKKEFTLSAWIYMNPSEAAQNPKETTILYYGQKEMDPGSNKWQIVNPKPKITYQYDPVIKRDMYNIYLDESKPNQPTYRLHIPNQRWNQFVFVYQADRIDFFINGHLEKSFDVLTKTYTQNDQIAIGDQETATYGAVANVIYYDYPMTLNQVVDAWNKQQYWVDGTLYVPYSRTK